MEEAKKTSSNRHREENKIENILMEATCKELRRLRLWASNKIVWILGYEWETVKENTLN